MAASTRLNPSIMTRRSPRLFPAATQRRRVRSGTIGWYAPWGVLHGRELDSPTSLCGETSPAWRMFFDRRFDPTDPSVCRDCLDAVREAAL